MGDKKEKKFEVGLCGGCKFYTIGSLMPYMNIAIEVCLVGMTKQDNTKLDMHVHCNHVCRYDPMLWEPREEKNAEV